MKNIHILPTDKPSRVYKHKFDETFRLLKNELQVSGQTISQNIYITNDEEIKGVDWCLLDHNVGQSTGYSILKCLESDVENGEYTFKDKDGDIFTTGRCKKIILTTDQDLIKDGLQAIPDSFLEWFIKNPSCEYIEIENVYDKFLNGDKRSVSDFRKKYKINIPKEEPKSLMEKLKPLQEQWQRDMLKTLQEPKQELPGINRQTFKIILDEKWSPKQETLEEALERQFPIIKELEHSTEYIASIAERKLAFMFGAKWQQKRSYSKEEVYNIIQQLRLQLKTGVLKWQDDFEFDLEKWFEQFKKK